MRFYIHSEEEPSFALPVQWDDADTRPVEALLQHCSATRIAEFRARYPLLAEDAHSRRVEPSILGRVASRDGLALGFTRRSRS